MRINEKFKEFARKAKATATAAAKRTTEFVQTHVPPDEELSRAKARIVQVGKAVGDSAAEFGKDVAQSKTFQDGAKGAAVGAVVAVPLPVVGPVIGAVVGAGIGVYLGHKTNTSSQTSALPGPPKDLHDELLKLDALRQRGLLTDAEFDAQKRKLLKSS